MFSQWPSLLVASLSATAVAAALTFTSEPSTVCVGDSATWSWDNSNVLYSGGYMVALDVSGIVSSLPTRDNSASLAQLGRVVKNGDTVSIRVSQQPGALISSSPASSSTITVGAGCTNANTATTTTTGNTAGSTTTGTPNTTESDIETNTATETPVVNTTTASTIPSSTSTWVEPSSVSTSEWVEPSTSSSVYTSLAPSTSSSSSTSFSLSTSASSSSSSALNSTETSISSDDSNVVITKTKPGYIAPTTSANNNGKENSNGSTSSKSLPAGAIAGIIIGAIVGAILLAIAVYMYMKSRNQAPMHDDLIGDYPPLVADEFTNASHSNRSPASYGSHSHSDWNTADMAQPPMALAATSGGLSAAIPEEYYEGYRTSYNEYADSRYIPYDASHAAYAEGYDGSQQAYAAYGGYQTTYPEAAAYATNSDPNAAYYDEAGYYANDPNYYGEGAAGAGPSGAGAYGAYPENPSHYPARY